MRSIEAIAAATVLTATVISGVCATPPAQASPDDVAINGTYRASSLGDWAKTNQQFHDEATVRSTWTVTSTCSTVQDCTGTVKSDQGWSAPMFMHDGTSWYVKRDVPDWEPCQYGGSATGRQTIYFYPVNANGHVQIGSPVLAGIDKTVGPSGACGQNRWLTIEMPFRLDKLS